MEGEHEFVSLEYAEARVVVELGGDGGDHVAHAISQHHIFLRTVERPQKDSEVRVER